jgi:hypothetical protein
MDAADTPVVYDNAAPISGAYLTWDYLFGVVTIAAGYGAISGPITADISYFPMYSVATARAYGIEMKRTLPDSTVFHASNDYRTRLAGIKSASGSLKRFDWGDVYYDGGVVNNINYFIDNSSNILLEMNLLSTKFRGWVKFTSDDRSSPLQDIAQGEANWRSILRTPASAYDAKYSFSVSTY